MTLKNACRAAILHGNALSDIKPEMWAATYHCSDEDVRAAWEAVQAEGVDPPPFLEPAPEQIDE